jgi:hypothetical protein
MTDTQPLDGTGKIGLSGVDEEIEVVLQDSLVPILPGAIEISA